MTDLNVTTIGLRKLSTNLKAKKIKTSSRLDKDFKQTAFRVEADAKLNSPIRRGTLRNSLHTTKIRDLFYTVSDGVSYGIWQEIGTRYIEGKHFLQRALNKNIRVLIRKIRNTYR